MMTCGRNSRIARTSGSAASATSASAKQPSGSGGFGSPSGRPESTKPRKRCSTPRISLARAISWRRTLVMSALISGRSMAGFRMSPRSPPVIVQTRTWAPSRTYLAIVAAPLLDSSSGCACTAISRTWLCKTGLPRLNPQCANTRLPTRHSPFRIVERFPHLTPALKSPTLVSLRRLIPPRTDPRSRGLQGPAQYQGVPVTETRDDTVTWLTQEAYDRLKAELDHLSGPGRVDIAKKIEAARDEGDLKENGGYHAAKDEQGQIEGRIRQLQYILENARVGDPPRTEGVVGPGMTVTVRFAGDEDEVTFLLASREESGAPIDVYSPRSPLGSAISGKKVGETATYNLPNGRSATVEILDAVPYAGM